MVKIKIDQHLAQASPVEHTSTSGTASLVEHTQTIGTDSLVEHTNNWQS